MMTLGIHPTIQVHNGTGHKQLLGLFSCKNWSHIDAAMVNIIHRMRKNIHFLQHVMFNKHAQLCGCQYKSRCEITVRSKWCKAQPGQNIDILCSDGCHSQKIPNTVSQFIWNASLWEIQGTPGELVAPLDGMEVLRNGDTLKTGMGTVRVMITLNQHQVLTSLVLRKTQFLISVCGRLHGGWWIWDTIGWALRNSFSKQFFRLRA